MGHLLLADASVDDFTRGVISFWFRLPSETVAAVREKTYDRFGPRVFGLGEIPLLTWGEQINALPPSHIAVRVGTADYAWGAETLLVHLQTSDFATGSGDHWAASDYPEYFGNSSADTSRAADGHPAILVDAWNHVILSWELGASSVADGSVTGFSKMWCAINDENKVGDQLPAMGQISSSLGDNDHLSSHVRSFEHSETTSASVTVTDVPFAPFAIPGRTVIYTISVGGGTAEKNPVLRVQMAELQVFSGVTLDTGITENRRAFVDEDGLPVAPYAVNDAGAPIGSVGLLGKAPEIILSGSGDWQEGHNSGSLGVTEDGENIVGGHFTPTGDIQPWEPDPSL